MTTGLCWDPLLKSPEIERGPRLTSLPLKSTYQKLSQTIVGGYHYHSHTLVIVSAFSHTHINIILRGWGLLFLENRRHRTIVRYLVYLGIFTQQSFGTVSWGLTVPTNFFLCSDASETCDHLLFNCSYLAKVWSLFTDHAHLLPPPQCMEFIRRWTKDQTLDSIKLLFKPILQVSIYMSYGKSATRVHNATSRPSSALISDIKINLTAKLDTLSWA